VGGISNASLRPLRDRGVARSQSGHETGTRLVLGLEPTIRRVWTEAFLTWCEKPLVLGISPSERGPIRKSTEYWWYLGWYR
jgi:hypothetical protein